MKILTAATSPMLRMLAPRAFRSRKFDPANIPGSFNIVTSFLRKVRGVLGNPCLGERI